MVLETVMLLLSIGSFLFGLLLLIFGISYKMPQEIPFWIASKILQALGSLLLYFRTDVYDFVTVLANITLLAGCAYEAWTIRILTGQSVKQKVHILTSAGIILACLSSALLTSPYRRGAIYLLQTLFYILPALFLFGKSDRKFSLRLILGISYCVTGTVFLFGAVLCFIFPEVALRLADSAVHAVISIISYFIFLVSGFIMLMLAREKSDMLVQEIRKSLKKSEIRFQKIVETAIEGILIFDENYRITFANKNMALMLGYTVEEMIGMSYVSLIPENYMDIYNYQVSLRKRGEDSVYECCLLRKDGSERWFLISAKAMFDDNGKFEGSFSVITDITERKEMERLLEETNRQLVELSNKDGLTGIANRRLFDSTLEQEYSKMKDSGSKLSIIMLDIDHFKEYNDYYGHVMGDECLRQVGRVLERCIRHSYDLAARYGGEEFAVIMPDTDIHSAVKIAERIQQCIKELKIEHGKSPVSEYVTASLGVATVHYSHDRIPEEIVAIADKLLYRAKVLGRNRIEYAEV